MCIVFVYKPGVTSAPDTHQFWEVLYGQGGHIMYRHTTYMSGFHVVFFFTVDFGVDFGAHVHITGEHVGISGIK
jgi:hypothetical protein